MLSFRHSFCPLQGDLEVAADVVASFTGLVVLVCGCPGFFFGEGAAKKQEAQGFQLHIDQRSNRALLFPKKSLESDGDLPLAYICTALLKAFVQTPSLVQR